MFKRLLSIMLACLLACVAYAQPVAASSKAEKQAQLTEKVRVGITSLGTGPQARVELKLHDKQKLKGYISETSAESFTVIGENGQATQVAYPQVKQVKGNNLAAGVKIAIGVAVVIGVIILVGALAIPKS
ncbi:MAG TPA: hypothetical protein VF131_25470 [Blastocatellia bacterium]|nr:hypothetical protein [Blastocatellia bacterium]